MTGPPRTGEAVVADPQVAVVANPAPHAPQPPVPIAALRPGKPGLCEKPLARDPAQALAMLPAAEAARVASACGFNHRFVPAIRPARQIVAAGRLGQRPARGRGQGRASERKPGRRGRL